MPAIWSRARAFIGDAVDRGSGGDSSGCRTEDDWCNCEQSRDGRGANMQSMNTELTNANQRVASAHQRLGLQRVRIRTLRAGGRDTSAAAAALGAMGRTMEASDEDRF